MKLAIISLGGPSSKEVAKEAKAYFDKVDMLNLKDIDITADTERTVVLHKGKHIGNYDCIYVRGSYKYALLQRSISFALKDKAYIPIEPRSFTLSHNKLLTLLELQKYKVPIPKTYFAASTAGAKELLKEVKYPVIIKIPEGTHGKGVMFADSASSAKSVLDALEVFNQPYIIQEYIETGATDIRAIVAGNRVIASMKRKAMTQDELRANIHAGGEGQPYTPDPDTEHVAVKSAKAIGADICAVDILEGREPTVIEINLSPGLRGITAATKKNVAQLVAKYLAEATKDFLEGKKTKTRLEELTEERAKEKTLKELITPINIKAGMIKLPKLVTEITEFHADEEVTIKMNKGKLIIEQHKIKKEY